MSTPTSTVSHRQPLPAPAVPPRAPNAATLPEPLCVSFLSFNASHNMSRHTHHKQYIGGNPRQRSSASCTPRVSRGRGSHVVVVQLQCSCTANPATPTRSGLSPSATSRRLPPASAPPPPPESACRLEDTRSTTTEYSQNYIYTCMSTDAVLRRSPLHF